jgi:hypothetical protein
MFPRPHGNLIPFSKKYCHYWVNQIELILVTFFFPGKITGIYSRSIHPSVKAIHPFWSMTYSVQPYSSLFLSHNQTHGFELKEPLLPHPVTSTVGVAGHTGQSEDIPQRGLKMRLLQKLTFECVFLKVYPHIT